MAKKKVTDSPVNEKTELIIEINKLVNSMKGRSSAGIDEIKKMYDLYNIYYKTMERDYGCSLCAIRIYTKLEKISKNYEEGKRIR